MINTQAEPLPVYDAYQFSANQMAGAKFSQHVTIYEGVRGYEFYRSGTRMWFLWSADGQEHTIQLFTTPSAVYDVFGIALPAEGSLTVSLKPVYIEWMP
jgi:hypothetical protein